MTVFSRILEVFTGAEMKKSQQRHLDATNELQQTIHKLSKNESALKDISQIIRTGQRNDKPI